jgi:uncharacterized membrane protein
VGKGRFEAFSDGVLAIIITIMVLELKVPHGDHSTDWHAIEPLVPVFLSYLLSFIYIGIYWNNHHHMLHATTRVSGAAMWANLHLLFWLSLVPFVTGWMGENHYAPLPTAAYGVVLLMAAIAYTVLQTTLTRQRDHNAALAQAIKRDGKGKLSMVLYVSAIPLAFVATWAAIALYVTVALIWLIPDRRIERVLSEHHDAAMRSGSHG